MWDALSGECFAHIGGAHWLGELSVVFGKRIVSGSYDGTVCVWDANSGECLGH